MRQRVVIALAIANDPDVIIADEPTTALDVTVQAQILDVLEVAKQETGAGIVLITHDLGMVAGHADEVAVMYAGRIVEKARSRGPVRRSPRCRTRSGCSARYRRPMPARGQPLVPIEGEPPSPLDRPAGCPFVPRCPLAMPVCHEKEPELVEVDARSPERVRGRRARSSAAARPRSFLVRTLVDLDHRAEDEMVLRVRGLGRSFPVTQGAVLRRRVGTLRAVSDVSFEIRAGETFCLVGESGSGKTTTLLEILGLRAPETGAIEVLGVDVTEIPDDARRSEIARPCRS